MYDTVFHPKAMLHIDLEERKNSTKANNQKKKKLLEHSNAVCLNEKRMTHS